MSRMRSRSRSRRREWSPTRMREPDVVYMLEIQEFERALDSDHAIVRHWPIIYGRTREAVYEWFQHVEVQRQSCLWLRVYAKRCSVGRRWWLETSSQPQGLMF